MRNVLVAISGPAGVGKGTLVKRLLQLEPALELSVSCTTRKPRAGEVDGREYYFISREEFFDRIRANDFLEYDEHFGNYYGTPLSFVERKLKEKSIILEIEVVGALNAKAIYPDTVLVMIVPPSDEELYRRLKKRDSETEEEIKDRLNRVRYELAQRDKYDYVVVNDDLDRATDELIGIIRKEMQKEVK